VDLDINAGWKIELLELVDGAGGRIKDIEKALVSAHLELVGCFFVLVYRSIDGELFDPSWQWDWTGDFSTSALGSLNDLHSRAVDCSVVKGAKADTDFLIHDESCLEEDF